MQLVTQEHVKDKKRKIANEPEWQNMLCGFNCPDYIIYVYNQPYQLII